MRRFLTASMAVAALGCSAPFALPTAHRGSRPPVPSFASRLESFPQVVPEAGQPGYRVCLDCDAPAPTPKTLAAHAGDVRPVAASQPATPARSVTVRFAASIPFPFASDALDGNGRAALDAFVARLPPGRPPRRLSVAGRTDNVGPSAGNSRIARARAEAVLAALRPRLRPHAEDISGEPLCCYIASNTTAAGRASNRRVDVVAVVESE